tara:strand:+ start:42 stop:1589 length:1548 start_codon:yes stop_codon:yes gene_type:complete
MPISSNRRQRVIEFATPKVADLVVVERVDSSKNVNSAATADDTAYGTAHPDTTRFPNFNLALIKNGDDEQGQFQDWYYVKDRADQDDYNWEFQAAGAGNPRFDTVVRTYVTLRSAFNESTPDIGNTTYGMPSGDVNITPFDADVADSGGVTYDNDYVLFEKKQTRSGDETLDSLYVVEQHVFVKRVTIRSVDADKQFSGSGAIGTPTKPYGGLVSKETLFYKNQQVVATIDFKDNDGGTDSPGVDNTTYRVNGAHSENGIAEYVFSDAEAYYDQVNVNPDGITGSISLSDKHPFWGVDSFGVMREGKQLSDNWYALSERMVVITNSNGLVAEYFTNQNMGWPAVFSNLYATVWNRRDGGKHTNVYPVYKREAYNGPTKTKVQIYWRKAPFKEPDTVDDTDVNTLCLLKPMEPMEMEFVTPNWRVKTKPSLHDNVTVTYTNGTEDPVWNYGGYKATWKATNYTEWPSTIVISDSQEAFRGGYLRTKVTAYKPNITTTDDADRHVPDGAPAGPVLDA